MSHRNSAERLVTSISKVSVWEMGLWWNVSKHFTKFWNLTKERTLDFGCSLVVFGTPVEPISEASWIHSLAPITSTANRAILEEWWEITPLEDFHVYGVTRTK